jgi:hypothetical protein
MTSGFPSICMNWTVYDVPAIWAMVSPEREWVSREQTSAWLRTSQMLDAHQSNLQLLRDRVAEHWAPEGSPASRTLLNQLDSLIDSTIHASEVARTNASALGLLTDALMEAKARVEPLHEAWAAATTDAERAELNKRAWMAMGEADSRVIEHASLLEIPPEYAPPPVGDAGDGKRPVSGGERTGSGPDAPPTAIPRLSETPANDARTRPESALATTPDSDMVGQGRPADGPPRWSTGPVLAAGGAPPASRLAGTGDDLLSTTKPDQSGSSAARHAPSIDGVLAAPPRPARAPSSRVGTGAVFGSGPDGLSPVATDGVIAGKKGNAGYSVPPEEGRSQQGGFLGGGVGSGRSRETETHRRQYPADEEWEMPSGVDSVIKPRLEPDPKKAFDPGPNVIGLRR